MNPNAPRPMKQNAAPSRSVQYAASRIDNGRAMAIVLEDVSEVFTDEGSSRPQTASTTMATSGSAVLHAALGAAPEQLHHVACLTPADGQPDAVAEFDL